MTQQFGTIEDSMWIDGARQVPSGDRYLPVDDSGSGEEIARLRAGTAGDVDRAFDSAAAAQREWARVPVAERVAVVHRAADLLEARAEELGDIMVSEVGTVASQVRMLQVGTGLIAIRKSADAAVEAVERVDTVGNSTVVYESAGVVGAITPWNYPIMQVALKVAPALAAGCSVVLKPPSIAPLTAFDIAEAFAEAGLPSGALNIVNGTGSGVGNAIASHRLADAVSFTGSVGAGRLVAAAAATQSTRTTLELGGKSAAIVIDEDLLEAAVLHTLSSCFANTGQTCAALSRLIVPRALVGQVEEIVRDRFSTLIVGDPRSAETHVGALASAQQQATVLGHIERAHATPGVRALASADISHLERGWFAPPTVFLAEDSASPIVQEEVFGPVLTVQPADSVDHAITLADDTEFGLIARLWTQDHQKFVHYARQLRVGGVIQSDAPTVWEAPFGGVKSSGYGRERGIFGVEEYLVPKSLQQL